MEKNRFSIARAAYIGWNYVLTHKRPFLASFKITYRCNLRCVQCPFRSLPSRELSFIDVMGVIDRLYERGSRMVVIEGGEPMMWSDGEYTIHDVVRYARRLFFSVGITTNGTQPLEVESDILWVSLDGFAETHNRLRGADVYDQILENIRKSSHLKLFAHITINRENAPEIPALVRFLNSMVRGITIQFYYPYHGQDELFLDFKQRAILLDEIIRLKHSGYRILNSTASLMALKRNTWKCLDYLVDCANPDGSITQGCYLKTRQDGDCSKCGFSPHTELSLACRGNPSAIWTGMNVFFR
jgi:MoaA/NifB/PqqE/SkfB family radical SAM enzyme